MTFRIVAIAALWLVPCLSSHAREWKDATGTFSVQADLVKVEGGKVHLRKPSGRVIQVPLDKLSSGDRRFLRSQGKQKATPEDNLRLALKDKVRWNFRQTPFSKVALYLYKNYQVNLHLDVFGLEEMGIAARELKVTSKTSGGDLASNLTAMLKPLGLKWFVWHDAIFVTTPEKAARTLVTRVYKVPSDKDTTATIRNVTQSIAPNSWAAVGGPAAIKSAKSGVLAISQTPAVHDQLARVLQPVRAAPTPKTGKTAKALSQATVLDFVDEPLDEVAVYLQQKHKVEFSVDREALEGIGLAATSQVSITVRRVRLSSGLSLMLHSMGLEWTVVDDGEIRLTTFERVASELKKARYNVDGLFDNKQKLVGLTTSIVSPASWSDVGGRGSVKFDGPTTLEVLQTASTLRRLDRLFADLRAASN